MSISIRRQTENSLRTVRAVFAAGLLHIAFAIPPVLAADQQAVPGDFSIDSTVQGKGSIRTSPQNLPIYVFDDDAPGKSNCNIGCVGAWTPVTSSGASKPLGDWTLIEREDHRSQWAYKGHPLYTHFGDDVGKPTGDGEDGKWHLFAP